MMICLRAPIYFIIVVRIPLLFNCLKTFMILNNIYRGIKGGNNMTILFFGNIPFDFKEQFKKDYPNQRFIFCEDEKDIIENLQDTKVMVGSGSQITEELVRQAPNLKWIMSLSAGVDKLPLALIAERNIIVTNARGVYKAPMAEYTISMLLQVYRHEKTLIKNENNREWKKDFTIREISGRHMVVVGAGAIGQEIARLAKAFSMTTYGVSRSGKKLDYFDENYTIHELDNVLPKADFVVSVLPGTKETEGIFTLKEFKQMKPEAVFVNIGRGNSVRSVDLIHAIQRGEIAHAILDVFEEEPLPSDHPFWTEDNITITPHLSAKSPRNTERVLNVFKQNLDKFITGDYELINIVNIMRGY